MNEQATVTITVDEYFDLRSRAEANLFLTTQLGQMDAKFMELDRRLWEFENKVQKSVFPTSKAYCLKRGK